MAIKGKKKSQKRGSQARRRPAAPPRPAVTPKSSLPWYRNPRIVGSLMTVGVLLIGLIVWQIQSNAEESDKLEKQQETLDDYTDQMRTIVQRLRAPAQAMAAAPPTIENEGAAETLADDAEGWVKEFETAVQDIGQIVPAQQGSIANAHNLYNQAIQIYLSAANTLRLAAGSEGDTQQEALSIAATQRAEATAVWTEATALLDRDREGAELDPSGITAPDTPATGGAAPPGGIPPGGEIPPGEIPPELTDEGTQGGEEGGGGQGGNESGGDGGGNGGGGQGNGNEQ